MLLNSVPCCMHTFLHFKQVPLDPFIDMLIPFTVQQLMVPPKVHLASHKQAFCLPIAKHWHRLIGDSFHQHMPLSHSPPITQSGIILS